MKVKKGIVVLSHLLPDYFRVTKKYKNNVTIENEYMQMDCDISLVTPVKSWGVHRLATYHNDEGQLRMCKFLVDKEGVTIVVNQTQKRPGIFDPSIINDTLEALREEELKGEITNLVFDIPCTIIETDFGYKEIKLKPKKNEDI